MANPSWASEPISPTKSIRVPVPICAERHMLGWCSAPVPIARSEHHQTGCAVPKRRVSVCERSVGPSRAQCGPVRASRRARRARETAHGMWSAKRAPIGAQRLAESHGGATEPKMKRPEVAPPSAKPTSWAVSRQAWRRDARGEFQEQASVQAPCSWKRPSQASKYRSVQRRCAR